MESLPVLASPAWHATIHTFFLPLRRLWTIHLNEICNHTLLQSLTSQSLATLAPDVNERKVAINFLLGAGLLKLLQHPGGKVSFRGVVKGELEA